MQVARVMRGMARLAVFLSLAKGTQDSDSNIVLSPAKYRHSDVEMSQLWQSLVELPVWQLLCADMTRAHLCPCGHTACTAEDEPAAVVAAQGGCSRVL